MEPRVPHGREAPRALLLVSVAALAVCLVVAAFGASCTAASPGGPGRAVRCGVGPAGGTGRAAPHRDARAAGCPHGPR